MTTTALAIRGGLLPKPADARPTSARPSSRERAPPMVAARTGGTLGPGRGHLIIGARVTIGPHRATAAPGLRRAPAVRIHPLRGDTTLLSGNLSSPPPVRPIATTRVRSQNRRRRRKATEGGWHRTVLLGDPSPPGSGRTGPGHPGCIGCDVLQLRGGGALPGGVPKPAIVLHLQAARPPGLALPGVVDGWGAYALWSWLGGDGVLSD